MRGRGLWMGGLVLVAAVFGVFGARAQAGDQPEGPFMGLRPTGEPQILFPGLISTRFGEYNGTFSPDGATFFYTLSLPGFDAIMVSRQMPNNRWSVPVIATFSGAHPDFDPLYAPDGLKLYFSSRRPSSKDPAGGPSHVWVMTKQASGWSEPSQIPFTDQSDYYSSLTHEGKIYFNSRAKERGNMDIYTATPGPDGYAIANLGKSVNSGATEADPFVAPDESYVIFRSYRHSGLGGADLYISFQIDGVWQKPHNLGAPINSSGKEMCPLVTVDGKLFIFASDRFQKPFPSPIKSLTEVAAKYDSVDNGNLNLYYMNTDFIKTLKTRYHSSP